MGLAQAILDHPEIKNILANGRTLADVLIKIVGFYAANTIAVGHVTTLK